MVSTEFPPHTPPPRPGQCVLVPRKIGELELDFENPTWKILSFRFLSFFPFPSLPSFLPCIEEKGKKKIINQESLFHFIFNGGFNSKIPQNPNWISKLDSQNPIPILQFS